MSNQAVLRVTKTVHRVCGEALDHDGNCSCSRTRLAGTVVESAAEFDHTPPDPYARAIAQRRAALGLPAQVPEQRPAAPVRAWAYSRLPSADPYEAEIKRLRRERGIERTSLPADYRPDGPPPDPYAAQLAAMREVA